MSANTNKIGHNFPLEGKVLDFGIFNGQLSKLIHC